MEPPHRFAVRWPLDLGRDATAGNATRVEFSLKAEGGGTRLTVVESGFAGLDLPEDDARARYDDHREGWRSEIGELEGYVAQRVRA